MSERKVITKYYPPDFDPRKLTQQRKIQSSAEKLESVRLSSPFSMRCNKCGQFIYRGRKFNARKQMSGEHYLNIPSIRLFIRCTACSSEIAFDTDFKNGDYKDAKGARRNFEPWRNFKHTQETEDEGKQDALTNTEVKATSAKREIAIANALDEIMMQNARREIRIRSKASSIQPALENNDQDEEAIRKAFSNDVGELVRRLIDEEPVVGEHVNALAYPVPGFQRRKRRKKDYGAALGIKCNNTA